MPLPNGLPKLGGALGAMLNPIIGRAMVHLRGGEGVNVTWDAPGRAVVRLDPEDSDSDGGGGGSGFDTCTDPSDGDLVEWNASNGCWSPVSFTFEGDDWIDLTEQDKTVTATHLAPSVTDHTVSISTSGIATGGGSLEFDQNGHHAGGGDSITIHVPDQCSCEYTGDTWINVTNDTNGGSIAHDGPGVSGSITISGGTHLSGSASLEFDNEGHHTSSSSASLDHSAPGSGSDQALIVGSYSLSGQNSGTSGASLTLAEGEINFDSLGHKASHGLTGTSDSASIPQVLGDMADVGGSPSEGDLLQYQSGSWVPVQTTNQTVVTGISISNGQLTYDTIDVEVVSTSNSSSSTVSSTECPSS